MLYACEFRKARFQRLDDRSSDEAATVKNLVFGLLKFFQVGFALCTYIDKRNHKP